MATKMSTFGRAYRLLSQKCHISRPISGVTGIKSCRLWRPMYSGSLGFHSSASLEGDPVLIKMPKLSPTMEEGTIVKWYKKEGDVIAPGDVLCDVETDKATVAMELEEEGILAKIILPENTREIKIGSLIALMVDEGDDWQNVSVPQDADLSVTSHADQSETPTQSPASTVTSSSGGATSHETDINKDGHLIGPAVKNLLDLYPIQLNEINGTGRSGAVLKGDVLRAIKDRNLSPESKPAQQATPAPSRPAPAPAIRTPPPIDGAPYEDVELTGMRRTIAKRLTESKSTIPHSYATVECTIDRVVKLRKQLMSDGVKLSVNDFVIKATAMALQQVPGVNATWTGESVRLLPSVDICVAVATKNGLITPILHNADLLGLEAISATVKELSQKARDGKLKPEEFQGGSFSISNLGMFGITEFTAVINPPQSCILAVGTSQLVLDSGNPRTVMRVTISADSRVVDDLLAARFLTALKQNLENPEMMNVGHSGSTSEQILDLDAL